MGLSFRSCQDGIVAILNDKGGFMSRMHVNRCLNCAIMCAM